MTFEPVHATVSACSALAVLLRPFHHASLFPSLPTGGRPDLRGERPELPEHPTRRGGQSSEVIAAPDDDGERRGPPAACQDGGGGDQVDRQLTDCRELCRQQHGKVSFER